MNTPSKIGALLLGAALVTGCSVDGEIDHTLDHTITVKIEGECANVKNAATDVLEDTCKDVEEDCNQDTDEKTN